MFKCTNCSWEGENSVKEKYCPVCGDNVTKCEVQIKKEEPLPKIEKSTIFKKTTKKRNK